MPDKETEERLINIEIALANQERIIEDLNQVIISQGKQLDLLQKHTEMLLERIESGDVMPLSGETPPPHY